MSTPTSDDSLQVRTVWPASAARDAAPANQFVVSSGPGLAESQEPEGSVYVVLGHLAPPLLVSPEDVQEFSETSNGRLEIKVTASVVMTQSRALELYHTLGRHLGVEPS